MKILIINGPNLNLLGKREPDIYGDKTLFDLEKKLYGEFENVSFSFFQSNHEGEIIDRLQKKDFHGVVINPASFSHSSIAIYDTLLAIEKPSIEVHISNIYKRESFRKNMQTAGASIGIISGLGFDGYSFAVKYLISNV
jgi:3-dehydroquinate dehydratase-2